MSHGFTIFAGTANPTLAAAIARELGVQVGACANDRFPDGEVAVRLHESVRHKEVFLVQLTPPPVNDHVVELLALADACRRAAAARITAIVPYFGYGRTSDMAAGSRLWGGWSPTSWRPLVSATWSRWIYTRHKLRAFFYAPVDTLTAVPTLCRALRTRLPSDVVVVSPDVGRVQLAIHYSQCLGAPVVVLHKRRESGAKTEVTHVVGDVSSRACLLVEDMISTGGTVAESIRALLAAGARPEITVVATHGLWLLGARAKLEHPSVREVLVTDTVYVAEQDWPQLRVISIAALIAGALERFLADGSLDDLY
jgi:ribose-phosphate pyrophosphokinase